MRTLTSLTAIVALVGCQPHKSSDMSEFAGDPEFHKAHTLRPTERQELKGKEVELKVGDLPAKAYLVGRNGDPAVIMIHEWWGLNNHIKETADKLADEKYQVLAVDLYGGEVATDQQQAGRLMQSVKEDRAKAVLLQSLKSMRDGTIGTATRVGTIGYCFGGGYSFKTAVWGGDLVQACVVYYGMPARNSSEAAGLKSPVLMVWPNKDQWINKQVVDNFQKAMKESGGSLKVEEYDADHAFANPSSKSYASENAKDAWIKTLAFFKERLQS